MTQQKYKTIYQDKDVLVNQHQIQIKYYIFPTCQSKIIPFSKIKHIQYGGLDLLSGGGRLWGMSIGKWGYWFAGDLQRFSRDHYIAIHTNSSIKKAFTTQNHRQVYQLIFKLWKQYQRKKQINGENNSMVESSKQQNSEIGISKSNNKSQEEVMH